MTTILPYITLETAPSPTHSIIWLHGLGADGNDFVPIADEMKLPVSVRYLFPHAPEQPVTINGGYVMRSWYDIVATDIGSQQDSIGVRASQAEIEKLIALERSRGIPVANIFLAGFSQGGAIALHTGIRQKDPLGGILALSTYLPLADTAATEASAATKNTPIFMAHGTEDPIVPHTLGKRSEEKLIQLGYRVDWREYDMPHSVCAAEIQDIERWLSVLLQQ